MYFDQIYTVLKELNLISIFVRLLLAVLFGGLIGIDRGRKRRPAGLRTHMLVCMGSTLVMITNQFITLNFQPSDPARLGAQVISGIGFLGAGTIVLARHKQVIGLTTAAGLWASACMGLAIGIGFYLGALMGFLFISFVVVVMHNVDSSVSRNSRVMEIYVEMDENASLSSLLGYMTNHNIKVTYIEIVKAADKTHKGTSAFVTLRLPKKFEHSEVLMALQRAGGVAHISEV